MEGRSGLSTGTRLPGGPRAAHERKAIGDDPSVRQADAQGLTQFPLSTAMACRTGSAPSEDHDGYGYAQQQEPAYGHQGDLGTPVGLHPHPPDVASSGRHRGSPAEPVEFQARAATVRGMAKRVASLQPGCRTNSAASHCRKTRRTAVWMHRATRHQTKTETLCIINPITPPRLRTSTTLRSPEKAQVSAQTWLLCFYSKPL